ncbi:hypothetical protein [Cellulosilyticum sp. I15G10I2]|uniref:hypothetical protein n=1 Tax=Cellulosilyticum sp. I15G10I2 TaxID=1892843 RepID=UPI00085C24B6|nr:hypothetical protein [Cellulosilyticum sp. I15G10I2]
MKRLMYYFTTLIALFALVYLTNTVEAYSRLIISRTFTPNYMLYFLRYFLLGMIGITLAIDSILTKKFTFLNFNKINLSKLLILGIPNVVMMLSPFGGSLIRIMGSIYNVFSIDVSAIILGYIVITSVNFSNK